MTKKAFAARAWIVVLTCAVTVSGADPVPAPVNSYPSDMVPPGTYLKTCQNEHAIGFQLSASCQTTNPKRPWLATGMKDFSQCRPGDIRNIYGNLSCTIGDVDEPPGSYIATCINLKTTVNKVLMANCAVLDADKYPIFNDSNWTSLPYGACVGDIANMNGYLECQNPKLRGIRIEKPKN